MKIASISFLDSNGTIQELMAFPDNYSTETILNVLKKKLSLHAEEGCWSQQDLQSSLENLISISFIGDWEELVRAYIHSVACGNCHHMYDVKFMICHESNHQIV